MIHYSDDLRIGLEANLTAHERRQYDLGEHKHAAVAIVVVDSDHSSDHQDPVVAVDVDMSNVPGDTTGFDGRMVGVAGGASFLLCRRASRLNRHAGQWALPGGRLDPGESPTDAALRELDEEVGLELDHDSVIGWLDDYPTRSGYVITPVVVWGGSGDTHLVPSPDEVLAVYRIGLHTLRDSEPRFVSIPESDRPVVQIPLGTDLIHAPTGAVLYQFRQVAMAGNIGERVDHLEQPVFAWK
jgi:ADP-ribose pyrophosphatase YjhB (NUDIX family)